MLALQTAQSSKSRRKNPNFLSQASQRLKAKRVRLKSMKLIINKNSALGLNHIKTGKHDVKEATNGKRDLKFMIDYSFFFYNKC